MTSKGLSQLATALVLAVLCTPSEVAGAPPSSPTGFFHQGVKPSVADDSGNELLLINTRRIRSTADPERLSREILVEQFSSVGDRTVWQSLDWPTAYQKLRRPLPTVIFVHGNRVERGEDRSRGMLAYRALANANANDPFRLLVWSWPAAQIPGPVKDFRLKAARAQTAGKQLAWAIKRIPSSSSVSILAYSLGARVVSGALHTLASESGERSQLVSSLGGTVRPVRVANVALIAAAVNADWLAPRGPHGQSLRMTRNLFVTVNRLDPAMRFYRWGPTGRGAQALGYVGINRSQQNIAGARIIALDATNAVGRAHGLPDYLARTPHINQVLRQLVGGAPSQEGIPAQSHAVRPRLTIAGQ